MTPDEIFIDLPEGRVFTLQWGEGPLLVFAHATGMCARTYLQLLEPLGAHYRIVAFDARGHGRTTLPADPADIPFDWKIYRRDIVALVDALGGGPVRLAGHSFGATSAFEAAVDNPGLASSVLLIDPPFIPFEQAEVYRNNPSAPHPMAEQAARRRSHFASREAAFNAYHGRGVFAGWPDRALHDYLEGGLLPDESGVHLACPPAWEANSFRGVSTTMQQSMENCRLPFTLLGAGFGSPMASAGEAEIRRLHPQARIERFPGTGHFLPVTHPDLVRPYFLQMP
ncbi:alpha/beta fold hydrolase [Sandaracinobacteroides hominis]|uniref:alpha/beta fold hydrolase n=1 Tax=Sandaracinobacteroides hominis TaxID=2780086 RepID=UPI0018F2E65B|nr:alpha/beta hydrolase [Sandaracinobacteroides hominis]